MMKEMVKKWGLFGVVLLLSMGIMAGCGTEGKKTQGETAAKTDEVNKESGEQFPVTITDDVNREVTIEKEPETILENLIARGHEFHYSTFQASEDDVPYAYETIGMRGVRGRVFTE